MIKIEISAETPAELHAAWASLFSGNAPDPVMPEVKEAAAAKPAKAAPAKAAAKPAAEKANGAAAALDFNTDVAPLVVGTVEKYGKPLVISVLETFGAAKASEVAPDQWGALVAALNEAASTAKPLA